MRERSRKIVADFAEEIGIAIGVALVAIGLWQIWKPGAFLAIGLVVLWVVLPSRAPFIERPQVEPGAKRRKLE